MSGVELFPLVLVAALVFTVPGALLGWVSGLRLPWAAAGSVPVSFGVFGLGAWVLGQLDIRGSWSWNGRETWEHAVDLLNRGVFDLDPMITNHYALGEWEQAFANLRAKQDVKAYIHPHGRDWEPG